MMRALYTAASGMAAQQFNLDTISNNLANVNTTGFRQNLAHFQDQSYQTLEAAGSPVGSQTLPVAQQVGLGVKVGSSEKEFTQGGFTQTSNPTDVAISGNGFFQVTEPNGTLAYTRDGSFKTSPTGALTTADGYLVSPNITIPTNATSVSVGTDGTVAVTLPGSTASQQIGQLTLATFANSAGLNPIGSNLFQQTAASGQPTVGQPGVNGNGTILSGYLENSNVSVVNEIVNMIIAQRAFEANSKAVTSADQMLSTAVQTKQ